MIPSFICRGHAQINMGLIIKLTIWSLIVGAVLYALKISPGEIYGWILDQLAWVWHWLAGTGTHYILLGASIVIPLYLISQLGKRLKRKD